MDPEEFRKAGREMVDYVAAYIATIRDRRVFPEVKQGYLQKLIPDSAPEKAEHWDAVFQDIERVIMPGTTHWHSPRFHAYYPTGNSWPAILADILSDAIGCVGFTWAASPACTELEVAMMDWLAKLLGLPEHFLFSSQGSGGGVIQGTASEACYVAFLAAKSNAIREAKVKFPHLTEEVISGKLICYHSDQAHTAAERAATMGYVKYRALPTDEHYSLRGETLKSAIEEDVSKGFLPFYLLSSLGTTGCCAFDNLSELGPICESNNIWLHVDAAYAGSALICPEFRHHFSGLGYADSFNFNPHKWMLINFDCSGLWLKNTSLLIKTFQIDLPILIKQPENDQLMPDYRHWQIPLGRRFRSLKLWFVMRLYGAEGLREHIRKQVSLAKEFEKLLKTDERFELVVPVRLGLVCFRLKGSNELNEQLLKSINENGKLHLTHSKLRGGLYIIRLAICAVSTNTEDIEYSWKVIRETAQHLLTSQSCTL